MSLLHVYNSPLTDLLNQKQLISCSSTVLVSLVSVVGGRTWRQIQRIAARSDVCVSHLTNMTTVCLQYVSLLHTHVGRLRVQSAMSLPARSQLPLAV